MPTTMVLRVARATASQLMWRSMRCLPAGSVPASCRYDAAVQQNRQGERKNFWSGPSTAADREAWAPLWDGYNAFYERVGPTALSAEQSPS